MIDLEEARQVAAKINGDADEKLFRKIVTEIPIKIRKNSEEGFYSAEVRHIANYRHRWYQFLAGFTGIVRPRHLTGVDKRIYEYCKQEGLRPYIEERGYDGGMYFIMIRW